MLNSSRETVNFETLTWDTEIEMERGGVFLRINLDRYECLFWVLASGSKRGTPQHAWDLLDALRSVLTEAAEHIPATEFPEPEVSAQEQVALDEAGPGVEPIAGRFSDVFTAACAKLSLCAEDLAAHEERAARDKKVDARRKRIIDKLPAGTPFVRTNEGGGQELKVFVISDEEGDRTKRSIEGITYALMGHCPERTCIRFDLDKWIREGLRLLTAEDMPSFPQGMFSSHEKVKLLGAAQVAAEAHPELLELP